MTNSLFIKKTNDLRPSWRRGTSVCNVTRQLSIGVRFLLRKIIIIYYYFHLFTLAPMQKHGVNYRQLTRNASKIQQKVENRVL